MCSFRGTVAIALLTVLTSNSSTLYVSRLEDRLWVSPSTDPLALEVNLAWALWEDQRTPTPAIAEGMFTLYGYSELAWGVVDLRARDYLQQRSYGASLSSWGEELVYLRGSGPQGFRDRLHRNGYDCAIALKSDDVGRVGTVSFWDHDHWTEPLWVIVLDSASGATWGNLRTMANEFEGHWFYWVAEVAKDCLEQVGLERLVQNNHSGFVRMLLDEAVNRSVIFPEYP